MIILQKTYSQFKTIHSITISPLNKIIQRLKYLYYFFQQIIVIYCITFIYFLYIYAQVTFFLHKLHQTYINHKPKRSYYSKNNVN